ncbi:MAG: DUF2892 domain-containing protein [Pseudomonadota bacterium]
MIENIGRLDRTLRLIMGLLLIGLPFVTDSALWASTVWVFAAVALGVLLALTALFRFCPAYRLFGIRTCSD